MLSYHWALLADEVRMARFREAIQETVRPGQVVVDVGTGTGVLACFACQAGARRVVAIEREEIIQLAREMAAANGFADRISFIHEDALWAHLDEPADLLMGEILGVVGLDERILEIYGQGIARGFLKPSGTVLPRSFEVFFAPWQDRALCQSLKLDGAAGGSLRMVPLKSLLCNRLGSVEVRKDGALAPALRFFSFTFPVPEPSRAVKASGQFVIDRAGDLQGICGWFEAQLSPGVRISNAPDEPRTSWLQGFLPLEHPLVVRRGDRVELEVTATDNGLQWWLGWSGKVLRDGAEVGAFDGHTFRGRLVPVDRLRWATTGRLPCRSPEGEVLRAALEILDGTQALAAGARALVGRFPTIFSAEEGAAQYLLSVADRYGTKGPGRG